MNAHSPALGLVLTAVISLAAGFFVAGFLPLSKTAEPASAKPAVVETPAAPAIQQPTAADATPDFTEVSEPVYNSKSGTYSFHVVAKTRSGDEIIYKLFSKKNDMISSNGDGLFLDVKPTQDGVYYVQAVNAGKQELATSLRPVSGFDVKEVAVAKVSKGDLTAKFNTGSYEKSFSGSWERTYLAPGCKFSFTGIREGERRPSDIGDICRRINMNAWASVNVTSVSYDALNRITGMTIAVNYPTE